MSIIQTAMPINKGKTIIVSSDKDMKTVPGNLYDPGKDEFHDISEAAAEFFLTQVLAGDPVDNVRRIPGIGPVKAKAALGPRPSWDAVEQAYIKAGMTREDAIKQARLVRILHHSDWDEKKERQYVYGNHPTRTIHEKNGAGSDRIGRCKRRPSG